MLIQINNDWQNLNTLANLAVGSAFIVQSQSGSRCYFKQQDTAPSAESQDAAIVDLLQWYQVTDGSKATWVRVAATSGQLFLEVL